MEVTVCCTVLTSVNSLFGKTWIQWTNKPKMYECIFLVLSKSSYTEQIIHPHTHTHTQNVYAIYLLTVFLFCFLFFWWKVDRDSLYSRLKFIPVRSKNALTICTKNSFFKNQKSDCNTMKLLLVPGTQWTICVHSPGTFNGMDTPTLYCIVK